MRVLLDECIPRKFKFSLAPLECQTVPEAGFAGKKNGELLGLAEGNFDVFVTLDKGVEFQQNLADKKIAIVIIRARSNRLAHVQHHAESCLSAIQSIQPGQLIRVG
jgi:predicted nuclease of predicted toxin-antitoxin system